MKNNIKAVVCDNFGWSLLKIKQNIPNWGQDIEQKVHHGGQTNVAHGRQILLTKERQVRPIICLHVEDRAKVWGKAVKTAPDGKVMAKHIRGANKALKM